MKKISKIQYESFNSEELGLMICSFDYSNDLSSGQEKTITWGETNSYRQIPNSGRAEYSGKTEFQLSLCKCDESAFTELEIRNINKLLTSAKTPRKLTYTYDDKTIIYKGFVHSPVYKKASKGVIGLTYTFSNNSPFCYEYKEHTISMVANNEVSLIFENDDSESYIYPIITVEYTGSEESIIMQLQNITDNNNMCIFNISSNTLS